MAIVDAHEALSRARVGLKRRVALRTCGVCLRVFWRGSWQQPEEVIRELQSFAHDATPRLTSDLCPFCADAIAATRAPDMEARAA
jgi:uncharacterized protein with PIN domain